MSKKIAVVGASIAGRVSAIVLDQLGYDVTVFERSTQTSLVDRGAGIWLPPDLILQLIEKQILAKNFPYLPISERPIYTYDSQHDSEKLLTTHKVKALAVHWFDLYEGLKAHPVDSRVRYGAEVTSVKSGTHDVTLQINQKELITFDGCIFADGGRSLGRSTLYPDNKPAFTDTVIWRGTVDRVGLEEADRFLGKAAFYVSEVGHFLLYLVPNKYTDNPQQDYKLNWLFYEHVDANHPFFKGEQAQEIRNFSRGKLPKAYQDHLHILASAYLPPFPRQIITATQQPFLAAMHDLLLPAYAKGPMALIGDASIALRAHTAAGATKAIQDALALGEQLEQTHDDWTTALQLWNDKQYPYGKREFELGKALGELFVTDVPDWKCLTKPEMDDKWLAVASDACWYAEH